MTPNMISAVEAEFAVRTFEEFPDLPTAYNGTTTTPDASMSARFFVLPSTGEAIGMCRTPRTRSAGVIYVEVSGPKDQGAGATQDVAWAARQWFSDLELDTPDGTIVFGRGVMADRGVIGEQFVTKTTIPFRCDYAA